MVDYLSLFCSHYDSVKCVLFHFKHLFCAFVCINIQVVGDIHGQFYDLLEIFKVGGECPYTNYMFLGNIVNRGYYSVECVLLLIALKARYPDRITLIRGNHECRQLTQVYGFYDECLKKFGSANVWRYVTDIFDYFCLGAIVDEKVFCMHSGLSPELHTIDQIKHLPRLQETPRHGALFDLSWNLPDPDTEAFLINPDPMEPGYLYGPDVFLKFREQNKFDLVVRAHSLCMEGYKTQYPMKLTKGAQPVHTLVTVWSAPNFCYRVGNVAAILELDENLEQRFKVFEAPPQQGKNCVQYGPLPEFIHPCRSSTTMT